MSAFPSSFWLVLDKPLGISSNQALSKVKRFLGVKKAGYAGTLDPLASGVLPIAVGDALKAMSYMTFTEKTYQFQVCFGKSTTTDDLEGDVADTSPVRPSKEDILKVLPQFLGEIQQIPPVYSALKINGKRACDRVRRGEEVVLQPRTIFIYDLKLLSVDDGDHATFEVRCSSGTYVRSLARDMAKSLGTVGCVSQLRRVAVGPFAIHHSLTFEGLAQEASFKKTLEKEGDIAHINLTSAFALPVDIGLDDILAVSVSKEVADRLRCGQRVPLKLEIKADGQTLRIYEGEAFIGFARYEAGINEGVVHPIRMINNND